MNLCLHGGMMKLTLNDLETGSLKKIKQQLYQDQDFIITELALFFFY